MVSDFKHRCPEWDGLVINKYDDEFGACMCFRGTPQADEWYTNHAQAHIKWDLMIKNYMKKRFGVHND